MILLLYINIILIEVTKMDKIKFRRKLRNVGDSIMVAIPKEILEYLGVESGKEIIFTPEKGKHGKFSAVYVEVQNNE